MALKRIVAPDDYPVTMAEVKAHLNVEDDGWDDLIALYIQAVVSRLEGPKGILQRALKPQIWELLLDEFPDGALEIPLHPLVSIDRIKYDDLAGEEQTLSTDVYVVDVDSDPGRIVFHDSFTAPDLKANSVNGVRIRFLVGYPDDEPASGESGEAVSTVPAAIKAAILLMVGDIFANRETVSENSVSEIPMSMSVKALLAPYKPFIIA